jgi:hypothetical protein
MTPNVDSENASSIDMATNGQNSDFSAPAVSVPGETDSEKGLGHESDEAEAKPPAEEPTAAGPAPATSAMGPPPDGGAQAWLAVLGAFCGLFVSFGWINCKSPLL